ncbi:MAG: class I SAM-dependent methyltransferase [Clostridia bacterium]|nr:class I SAM-dependent methyltransferase [Clostridia bacterium]
MLEEMSAFFTARVNGYDEHMLRDVGGCRECYEEMARLVPEDAKTLLDLGCGTGLELDFIFPRFPDLAVTGVDLTRAMLDELRRKHPDKVLNLICGSYFDVDFGEAAFDAAVSFQTMHHFTAEKKRGLYERVRRALKPGGVYVECDYMIEDDAEEAFHFAELDRMRREQGLSPDEFVHYDTPLTIAHQEAALRAAGFASVEKKLRVENTTILVALA